MRARLAIAPIAWSNDDLLELGGDTPLETCLSESRLAGFAGVETGGKFPTTAAALAPVLEAHGLALASGWYSGTVLDGDLAAEKAKARDQIELFRALGAPVIAYGETAGTIQNRRDVPLDRRRTLSPDEIEAYGERLTRFAAWCAEEGVRLAFHHHVGTVIETEAELDALMAATGEEVGLLFDTGHLRFAGGDVLGVIRRHGERINHVHMKDVRAGVLAGLDRARRSFLDAVVAGVFTVPGDGAIDFAGVARVLAEVGYEGWFVVEAEQDPATAPPLDYAKIGHRALTKALEGAGYTIGE